MPILQALPIGRGSPVGVEEPGRHIGEPGQDPAGRPDHRRPGQDERAGRPAAHVDRVTKPVLIVRGDRDGFPPAGIDDFVAQLHARGRQATSVVYEGDGHFFRRANELDFLARVESLFARCLGGRSEPLEGDRHPGSTGRVRGLSR
jgi:pimeloyl-ACP methyl ester carboxylesterase